MDYNVTYRQKDKGIQCIVSYKDNLGKWKQKSKQGFKTQKESKVWIKNTVDALEEEMKLDTLVDPRLKEITFKVLMDKYIEHKKIHRTYATIRQTEFARNKFETLEDMLVKEITSLHTQDCIDGMVKQGLSHNTVSSYITAIKTAFNYAIDKKIINVNPLDRMTIPENKVDDRIKALDKHEYRMLIAQIKNKKYRIASILAATCGLRIGEIMGLCRDRVDLTNATIKIDQQWKRLGKNNWGFGELKRKNSNRIIPIPNDTVKELEKYLLETPSHISGRIFYNNKNVSNLSEDISATYRKLGYDITIHDLRHTYATFLIGNGVDFKTAAKLLGHDIEMTMKTYSHVTDDMMKKATQTINRIF